MRDNGVVELPVTVPRETFLKELEYYGFDIQATKTSCITCIFPVVDTLKHIDKLHERFICRKIELHLDMELWVIAYACYCEILSTKSLDIRISIPKVDSIYALPNSLLDLNKKLPSREIVAESLVCTAKALEKAYEYRYCEKQGPIRQQFNNYLSEFGFECKYFRSHTLDASGDVCVSESDHVFKIYADLKMIG